MCIYVYVYNNPFLQVAIPLSIPRFKAITFPMKEVEIHNFILHIYI